MSRRSASKRTKRDRILARTSLTVAPFAQLGPAFERAFFQRMDDGTLEGKRRRGRSSRQDANCPRPSSAARLLVILCYLNHAPTQPCHGAAFGRGQPQANPWIHARLPALHLALAARGDLPVRTHTALLARLAHLSTPEPRAAPAPFLSPPTARVRSSVRTTRMNKRAVPAARRSALR